MMQDHPNDVASSSATLHFALQSIPHLDSLLLKPRLDSLLDCLRKRNAVKGQLSGRGALSITNHDASLPVAYRLYLPKEWAGDRTRRRKVGIPEQAPQRRALCLLARAMGTWMERVYCANCGCNGGMVTPEWAPEYLLTEIIQLNSNT